MQNVVEKPEIGFRDFGLCETTLKALQKVNYQQPSPIQAALIPIAIEGRDCTGQAQTGTGKTAAFALPILQRLDFQERHTQALVLTPTRELSDQVCAETLRLADGSNCRVASCVGGRPIRRQIDDLKRGIHVVVGTPGRILDLISRKVLNLEWLKIVVLDEADRMLDIGFRPDIERILRRCPRERQTLLLSATMPPPVERLAQRYMQDPQRIDLSCGQVAANTVEQFCITVDQDRKFTLLTRLLVDQRPSQALVFTRTKRGADSLYRRLSKKLPQAAVIHGDLQQRTRDRVLQGFRDKRIRLLVATDVIGRGIDVTGISHIINYDIPQYCDDYVHRIGRTGRMNGSLGRAFTFVTPDEGSQLTSIEVRVNNLLQPYLISDFEAFRPKPARAAETKTATQAGSPPPRQGRRPRATRSKRKI